ncbi:MAG: sel1 repeat family protein [Planctomycetota bacterium]|nr:MAG: sel1 repeat family protein [Planctomycetota bacterium]
MPADGMKRAQVYGEAAGKGARRLAFSQASSHLQTRRRWRPGRIPWGREGSAGPGDLSTRRVNVLRPRASTSAAKLGRPEKENGYWTTRGGVRRGENRRDIKDLGLPHEPGSDPLRNSKEGDMTGQELYEKAERLAREADKNGNPLPVALLQQAAATGYPPAVYALANWHLHGKGVRKDFKKAFALLTKSAHDRFAPAEYDLAVSYELGKGVERSKKKAWLYYLQAANDGDLDAQTEVARCFYYGLGTRKDLGQAVDWYTRAAERGDAEAQYALGRAHELGEGIDPDLRKALHWYKKAAAQGHKEARRAVADLQRRAERSAREAPLRLTATPRTRMGQRSSKR